MIRRPSETIRHISIPGARPGDTGSRDSDGINPRVGGTMVPGTGRTVYQIASAASAGKPAPAVTANPRDIFLRRALGTRYFPVLGTHKALCAPVRR
jgi:hypothetical protein